MTKPISSSITYWSKAVVMVNLVLQNPIKRHNNKVLNTSYLKCVLLIVILKENICFRPCLRSPIFTIAGALEFIQLSVATRFCPALNQYDFFCHYTFLWKNLTTCQRRPSKPGRTFKQLLKVSNAQSKCKICCTF